MTIDGLTTTALGVPALSAVLSSDRLYEWIAIGTLSALLLAGAIAVVIYWKVVVPRRRRRPLLAALALLASDHEEAREQVEHQLAEAITGGLAARDLVDARFALAYLRARMGKLQDARVAALEIRDRDADAAVWFLRLWLHAQLKDHRAAIEIWQNHGPELAAFAQATEIAAICHLSDALALWRQERIDDAVLRFKAMRKLGVAELDKHVPAHIDQHQIVQGIRALHNSHTEEARKSFQSARDASDANENTVLAADAGLLLCEWREQRSPNIDDALRQLRERCERLLASSHDKAQQVEQQRVLAGLLLWHAVSWLFVLREQRPAKAGLHDADRQELAQRLARTEAADPELADARLIRGLVDYYFAKDPEQRTQAVARLKQVSETGVQVPEVAEVVRKEERLKRSLEERLASYLRLGRTYLAASHVSLERRRALREYLERFEPFKKLDPIDESEAKTAVSPSVAQLSSRVTDMRAKLARVVRSAATDRPDAENGISTRLEALDTATRSLVETAQTVETAEYDLMITAGELFIVEEQVPVPLPPVIAEALEREFIPILGLPARGTLSERADLAKPFDHYHRGERTPGGRRGGQ